MQVRRRVHPPRDAPPGQDPEEIDYTRSSLFDIAFFDLFFRINGGNEIVRLQKTIEALDKAMPGVARKLSLRIVARLRRGRYRDFINDETLVD